MRREGYELSGWQPQVVLKELMVVNSSRNEILNVEVLQTAWGRSWN